MVVLGSRAAASSGLTGCVLTVTPKAGADSLGWSTHQGGILAAGGRVHDPWGGTCPLHLLPASSLGQPRHAGLVH